MPKIRFSVVIPARNEEKIIASCLSSFQNQTYPKDLYEVIVVDNGSQDRTSKIAKIFGARVVSEPKRGIAYARDAGARASRGEIVVGTDADCQAPADFLEKLDRALQDPKIGGVCGTVYFCDKTPLVVRVVARILSLFADFYSRKIGKTPICWATNFAFRKSLFEKIGGYNLSLPLLKAGLNTQGSDEEELAKGIMKNGYRVIFDKNIYLLTSGRRFNNRFLYWLVVEYIIGFIVNKRFFSSFGFPLPLPSYYDRVSPRRFYTVFHTLLILFFFAASLVSFWLSFSHNKAYYIAKGKELNRLISLRTKESIKPELENLYQRLNIADKIIMP